MPSKSATSFWVCSRLPADAEAQPHDELLPLGQVGDAVEKQILLRLLLDVPVDAVGIAAQNIGEEQLVAVPIDVEGLVDGELVAQLGIFAQMHENFVLDAAGGIGRKLDVPGGAKGVDRLDEPDGADADEILDPHPGIFKFARDIDHQAEIVGDEHIPRLWIPLFHPPEYLRLLLLGQWGRQGVRAVDVMELPAAPPQ